MNKIWKFTFTLLAASTILIFLALFSVGDGRLHLVFCDVGQGDAALIFRGTTQILVDGGPDNSVLSCISRHTPFWDRKIELVVMTHPQEDHLAGLVEVLRRYKVENFAAPQVQNQTPTYQALKIELEKEKAKILNPTAGTKIRLGTISLETLWPNSLWLTAATASQDLNNFSLVQRLSFGEFDALLTGDIGPAVSGLIEIPQTSWEVLKVPHHGSKNGLTAEFLAKINPRLAVISVGKNNQYGHPHEETIRLLDNSMIRTLRTDINGEIEVITDGKSWFIE